MQIKQDFVPKNQSNRPGFPMNPRYITVHNTANTSRGADAQMHARYIKNPLTHVSWHFTVDDGEIIYQHLPTNENGWHAGDGRDGTGNRKSIGIEICENVDGNLGEAIDHAVWLIKRLMKEHNIPIENVVPHKKWSGKNCPRKILPTWSNFIAKIKNEPVPLKPEVLSTQQTASQKPAPKPTPKPAKKEPTVSPTSLVDWMKVHGMDSSFNHRATLAKQNGITGYTGTAAQNNQLLNMLKGVVSKPSTNPSTNSTAKSILPNATYRARKPYPQGSGVKKVQEALASLYFYPNKGAKNRGVDGIYGPNTADAVRRFQTIHGLTADGIYGPKTKQALEKALK